MHKKVFFLLSLLTLICATEVAAQQDTQTLYMLARQAKDNGEDKKAIGYFEELYSKSFSDSYYKELFELYNKTGAYDENEKLLRKRIRKLPGNADLRVDEGYLAELQGEVRDAEKAYEEAIDLIDKTDQQTRVAANRFIQYKKYNYAEQAYLKARKLQRDDQLYRFDLANMYAQQGKTTEMIDEYLAAVGENRAYLQTVQNLLQRVLNPDPDGIQEKNSRTSFCGTSSRTRVRSFF